MPSHMLRNLQSKAVYDHETLHEDKQKIFSLDKMTIKIRCLDFNFTLMITRICHASFNLYAREMHEFHIYLGQ